MRKSRFFSLLCAVIPGAGPMYLGLMKRGASQMLLFCVDILLSIIIAPMLVFLPVIWFYSFFETLNLRNMTVGQIQDLVDQDDYVFSDLLTQAGRGKLKHLLERGHLVIGWVLVGSGVYVIYERLSRQLWNFIYSFENEHLYWFGTLMDSVPTVIVSLLLIWLGVRLIRGKKIRVLSEEEDFIPYHGDDGRQEEERGTDNHE